MLKDIIVRYKSLCGFYSPWVLGWDTHGLPIEHKMLSLANLNKEDLNAISLRKKAATYASDQIQNQKEQFASLQLFTDMNKIYITMDKKYEVIQLKVLKKLVMDGLVYKALKPVYWSPSSQSALAESEVEYQDVISPSIFVALPVIKSNFDKISVDDNLVIWTTTPRTLIANAGVAVGKEIEYVKIKYNEKFYIFATELLEKATEIMKWDDYEVVNNFLGKDIKDVWYNTPILKKPRPISIWTSCYYRKWFWISSYSSFIWRRWFSYRKGKPSWNDYAHFWWW
ncbi:class I tRNA ligase family protein [Mycoplasmopsis cynos]|uniref:class I tRNA ligase family protein n=1 Tax=Mycoplasmopsis cynos TaxID=171284 RepID=UPI003A5C7AC4